jgi:2-hydroxy-6-oxonona-2,4-dienedioate hydrolase
MNRKRLIWAGVAAAVLISCGAIYRSFANHIALANERVQQGSQVFESRFGSMEYAVAGSGSPAIMIHGTGGGFDQGLAFSARLVTAGHKIIALSRFGYLRTAFPADPSSENQADAIVDLMDKLGIARAPIIGGSAGALSAIQFAIRHPGRCSALVLIVPATFVPNKAPMRPNAVGAAIMEYGLRSDFLFWAGTQVAEQAMISTLLATDRDLFRNASPQEMKRVRKILDDILPVSARSRGILNDAKLAGTPAKMELERVNAPTLAISLEDDRFETFAAAKHIAETVPNAKLVSYPTGGHVFIGRDAEAYREIDLFVKSIEKQESYTTVP